MYAVPHGTSRIAAAVLAATALGVPPLLNAADATRTVRIASHISIGNRELTFRGRVTSPNAACKDRRRVTLHRTNGDKLGSTTTGPSGKWKITASGSAGISLGHFFATVRKSSQGTAGTIFVCKAARSKTIALH
jgi:hypothetical protein